MGDLRILFVDNMNPISASPFREVELIYLKKHLPNTHYFLYPNNFNISKNPILFSKNFNLGFGVGLNPSFDYVRNIFERIDLPFVFELYPGFGFFIDDSTSDAKLRYLFGHKLFKGVVITMPLTLKYVTEKNLVDKNKILFKYGGFIEMGNIVQRTPNKTPNIYFIAQVYGNQAGIYKGFDTFYEASKIYKNYNFIAFGGWQRPAQKNLKLFGSMPIKEIIKLINIGDIFISNNRWYGGQLDGFPTTCAVEAGLVGATLLLSDLGNNNVYLKDDVDFIKIEDSNALVKLGQILKNDALRISMGLSGSRKIKEVFETNNQIRSRIDFYEKMI